MEADIGFMRLAIEEARQALAEGQLPVGAIVVKDGEVVGRGRRFAKGNSRLDHAEMRALKEALDKGHTHVGNRMAVYSTLEPCVMCFGTILNSRIEKLVYALEDPYGGAAHFDVSLMPVRHKEKFPSITKGVLRDEVVPLFKKYFETTEDAFWKHEQDNPLRLLVVKDER